ncbi:MAG: GDP-mannose 4,6-dehydratase [Flavobacteriales bacterium]|nr:GDP-mannose 4,6-dehydratase [Flavobacteriales bacterium]
MTDRATSPVLLTGGAGFIGSHACEALLAAGRRVRCFDNYATGKRDNIAHLLGSDGFELVEGDLRDARTVAAAMQGCAQVVHLGALGSVPRSIADPLASEAANLTGFLHVLEAARHLGVDKVVFASSSSVYGDSPVLPKREGAEGAPLSPYAVTKAMDEVYAALYGRLFGVRTIGLRFFNVFGERQDPSGPYAAVIPRFILALLRGERPVVHGDGRQTRDFTYVANAVQAVVAGLDCSDPGAVGRVFNIALGRSTELRDVLAHIQQRLAQRVPSIADIVPEHGPDRPGDVRASLADITLARQVLRYEPKVDLWQGLDRTIDAYAG